MPVTMERPQVEQSPPPRRSIDILRARQHRQQSETGDVTRKNTISKSDETCLKPVLQSTLSIVVFGASGDLAKKKTFAALCALYQKGFLPARLNITGYARTKMTSEELHEKLRPGLSGSDEQINDFLKHVTYMSGPYDKPDGYQQLADALRKAEDTACHQDGANGSHAPPGPATVGRLLYLALPPEVVLDVSKYLSEHLKDLSGRDLAPCSWVRMIMEKPFGVDYDTSEELADNMQPLFSEKELYRIDHYLGKELVQNMLVLRFANSIFGAWWNRQYIANVQIIFKESFGTEGRGGYFDSNGIIRDVLQNHLIQVLALLTMEAPLSLSADDVRDEKVKLLRSITPLKLEDVLLGQYTGADGKPGYLDDDTVPKGSKCATFAACQFKINNERWAGVPIIIKAGKGLNETTAIARIQLKTPPATIFGNLENMRNELVIRFSPEEAIYSKMVVKKPGLDMDYEMSELDLTYPERYADVVIPGAYERLILDAIRGDDGNFVRRDELKAAWKIFTPLLHQLDAEGIEPQKYPRGSRGPTDVDKFTAAAGYIKTDYSWNPPQGSPTSTPKATSVPKGKL